MIGDYLWINGVRQTAYKLVLFEGNYYYIFDGHKVAKNVTLYMNNDLKGTELPVGRYYFDLEGKMIIP